MNNFRRSVEEIVQVVKIADTTLKKRLDEFKNTPSGELTVGDFRSVWLEAEVDPPAFTKGREKEEEERLAREGGEEVVKKMKKKKRKGKRKREDSDEEELETLETELKLSTPAPAIDPALLNAGILAGTSTEPQPLFLPEPEDYPETCDSTLVASSSMPIEDTVSTAVAEEVSTFLSTTQGTQLSEALDEAEQRRLAEIEVGDELTGLDEEELDRFLLTDEEVKVKERVWVEINRDYLEALAGT